MREQLFRIGQLDYHSLMNDRQPVCYESHDRQIMRYKQVGKPVFLLKIGEKIEHLRPDGYIQRADGLVCDDKLRMHGQHPGDSDTLPLPSRELMREPRGKFRRKPHIQHGLLHKLLTLLLR